MKKIFIMTLAALLTGSAAFAQDAPVEKPSHFKVP